MFLYNPFESVNFSGVHLSNRRPRAKGKRLKTPAVP